MSEAKHFYMKRTVDLPRKRLDEDKRVQMHPFGCVVVEKAGDNIWAAFSVCSPHDQWSKYIARSIAYGRLKKSAFLVSPGDKIEECIKQSLKIDVIKLHNLKGFDLVDLNHLFSKTINLCLEPKYAKTS